MIIQLLVLIETAVQLYSNKTKISLESLEMFIVFAQDCPSNKDKFLCGDDMMNGKPVTFHGVAKIYTATAALAKHLIRESSRWSASKKYGEVNIYTPVNYSIPENQAPSAECGETGCLDSLKHGSGWMFAPSAFGLRSL